jgi:hypothetical protein
LVTDLNHFLDLPEDTPGPARRLAEHLGNIVRAATAGDAGTAWESAPPCRRWPARRAYPGRMIVLRLERPAPIGWQCSACDDEGVICNWEDSPFDLRRRQLTVASAVNEVVISEAVAAALRELRLLDTDKEAEGPSALFVDSEFGGRQQAFRSRLADSGLTAVTVTSPGELEAALLHALVELEGEQTTAGQPTAGSVWMVPPLRGDEITRPELAEALVAAVLTPGCGHGGGEHRAGGGRRVWEDDVGTDGRPRSAGTRTVPRRDGMGDPR